ncbi:hypothetical protein N656DRAFT_773518, partial [Canariomyces notabilis]
MTGTSRTSLWPRVFKYLRGSSMMFARSAARSGRISTTSSNERRNTYGKLARAAIVRRIPLRTIAIRFTAFAEFSTQTARKGLKYPWDCMNRLAAEILPSGIQLSYNKPTV